MSEIKNSKLLEFILSYARGIGKRSSVMTASRFLASVIDVYTGTTEYRLSAEEKEGIHALLARYLPASGENYADIRQHLSDLIENADSNYMDSIYMQKKLFLAKEDSRQKSADVVDAGTVLELILKDPDKTVRECLFGSDSPEAEGGNASDAVPHSDFTAALKSIMKKTADQNAAAGAAATDSEPEKPTVPPKSAMAELTEKVKKTHNELANVIFGQDNAISVFTTGYFQAELSALTDKRRIRPRATFLFAGPPGVGKTFLAEKAAEILGIPFMRFDMSEYSDKEATLEFIGSDKVYRGAKEGNVTGFVAKNPTCVLLFDEIEKAHINIIHLFLQLLDAGRLRDSFTDKEVAFTDAIIIFTTNAGKQLYEDSELSDFSGITRKVILKALQKDTNAETGAPFFPAAICSRFASGNVVLFNYITANNLRDIARKEVLRHAKNFENAVGINIEIDEMVYTALLFAEGGTADARTIRSRAETFFDDELFELFRLLDAEKVGSSIEDLDSIAITVELPQDNDDIKRLFMNVDKPEILLVASQQVAKSCRDACSTASFILAQNKSAAKKALQDRDIRFALLDMSYKRKEGSPYLNIEDVESSARDLFWYIRENHGNLPVYILQCGDTVLSAEEKTSFLRHGVRGIISLSDSARPFSQAVEETTACLHQQRSMDDLARANKLLTFETAQSVFEGGKKAEIKLFDFEMAVAVDAGDEKNILSNVSKPDVQFEQVIGADDAKKELYYFVEYLKNPKRYLGTGVSTPKGVLLYGPPGTGKTLLAKATASASDVTFIAAEGNQFLKRYVGEGPEAVHELFRTARKYAPSILFIDEIDAIAKTRTGDNRDSSGDILTAFLTEMDGFKQDPSRPVFVLAATNFEVEPGSPNSLDPALLRRFDRRILVDIPDRDGRTRYIRMRMADNPAIALSDDKVSNIAIRSTGMSLADLASVIELALRSAIRDGNLKVTDDVFEEAFETFTCGESKHWDAAQLERVARHEAGHAFLCWQSGETPSYLTIVARGSHGGYMQHNDNEGKAVYTKQELLARLRTALGGRAAEIIYYGEENGVSSGASGDLKSATAIARNILCSYGMDSDFGLSYIETQAAKSGDLSSHVHKAVNKMLAEEMQKALQAIASNRAAVDALVEQLLVKNHMSGAEIQEVLASAAQ